MKLKLAKQHMDKEAGSVSLKDIENLLKEKESLILYFDQENAHKNLLEMQEKFEEKDYSVYLKEVKYGLDESDYIYEAHIL
ncbi:MAG TPA: hypothetical protein EYG95_06520 [Campylobacterales bacterium]|nr:hypothetical protein [Campylobacterales bacterium]